MRSNPRPMELSWYAYRSRSVMRSISSLFPGPAQKKARSKCAKDLRQAATLVEALVERFPGGVGDALTAPKSAARHVRAAAALTRHLPASAEAAWEALKSYGKSQAPRHRGCVPRSSCANWLPESAAYECRNFVGSLAELPSYREANSHNQRVS